jgi:hypothetical protein
MRMSAPRIAPTLMPAFAPAVRPEDEGCCEIGSEV